MHQTARWRWCQRTLESRARVVTLAGTQLSRRTSTFPVMLRVASTDSLCAMKPSDQRINSLFPDNRVFPNDGRALLYVHFGAPFLNRYETSVLLERCDERLVLVGHFLIQFRRAIAGRLGQEIPHHSDVPAFFRPKPALRGAPPSGLFVALTGRTVLPAEPGLGCTSRLRFPAIRRRFLCCRCGSQFPAPFYRKMLRLACLRSSEPRLTTPLPWRSNQVARHRPG